MGRFSANQEFVGDGGELSLLEEIWVEENTGKTISEGAGSGDVVGPASNSDGYIPVWNGANSKTLAAGIANASANWNTAYGWGNHASAGYVTGTPWTSMGYLTSTDLSPYSTKAQADLLYAAIGHNHTGVYQPVGSYLTAESDPVFVAWNKSTGISITKSQVSDFPTALSAFTNDLGNYGSFLTAASALDPSKVSQTASYRFVTDTEKSTWNGKQAALNGTGFLKMSGTTVSYDNSTYLTSLSGALLATGATTGATSQAQIFTNGVGIGISAVTMGALEIKGGATFTNIPAATSALGFISSSTGWSGYGFLFSDAANSAFGLVYAAGTAYFGGITNVAQAPWLSVNATGINSYGNIGLNGSTIQATSVVGGGVNTSFKIAGVGYGANYAASTVFYTYDYRGGAGYDYYEALRLRADGAVLASKILIGAPTVETEPFVVNSATADGMRFQRGGTDIGLLNMSNNYFNFVSYTDVGFNGAGITTPLLFIDGSAQKISIGNTSPNYTLDITGDLAVSGSLRPTVAAGSILAANSANVLSAVTSTTGTKVLTNTTGTVTWENAPANSYISNETPSGALDGADTTYTLANSPITGTLKVYLNGQRLTYTDDYTLATNVITFVVAPVSGDVIRADYELAGATSGNADTLDNQHGSYYGIASEDRSGWFALGACTYEGADAPSYTISFASDMTGVISAGMRIKLTDSTVKYFIVTAVGAYSGGKTIITVYGGTDFTLSGGAITSPFYSVHKAPVGFPLSPVKWTVESKDVSNRSQSTPTASTWYNLNAAHTISVPIGCWRVMYSCTANSDIGTAGDIGYTTTLSTANNSESDTDFTRNAYNYSVRYVQNQASVEKHLLLAAKTSYYLNISTENTGVAHISIQRTIIRAVCAYL